MPIRNVDKDVLEDVVRETADSTTGFLELPEDRNYIQREYEERVDSIFSVSSLTHDQIRSVLDEFDSDGQKEINHVTNEVYMVNPFSTVEEDGTNPVQETVLDMYRSNVVFDADTIRREFNIAPEYAEFFVEELRRKGILKRLSRSPEVYTISEDLEQAAGANSVEDRIKREAANGIITNDRFERLVSAPLIDEVTELFESEGYIIDLGGEYLVRDAVEDYAGSLTDSVEDDIEQEFIESDYLILESTYRKELKRRLRSVSDALPHISDSSVRNDIIDHVDGELRDRFGLDTRETESGEAVVVMSNAISSEIDETSEEVFISVRQNDYAKAERYYEAADGQIEDVSVSGNETISQYFRDAVREQVRNKIRTELFGREPTDSSTPSQS